MPSLLDLPAELRYQTINEVVSHRSTPPARPADYPPSEPVQKHDFHGWHWHDVEVRHPSDPAGFAPNALPLLQANRQLAHETKLALLGLHCHGFRHELDVMLADERTLLPTWTHVPALTECIPTVAVTFRIFGVAPGRSSGFQGGNGGPPTITWCFYHLLKHFLAFGPAPLTLDGERRPAPRPTSIRALEIDVRTPTEFSAGTTLAPRDMSDGDRRRANARALNRAASRAERGRDADDNDGDDLEPCRGQTDDWPPHRLDPDTRYVMHPDALQQFLQSELGSLLNMSYHTAIYGAALYERIGTIRMSVDGAPKVEWDLAQRLADFPPEGPFETFCKGREQHFPTWREKAWRERKRVGLPVIRSDWAQPDAE